MNIERAFGAIRTPKSVIYILSAAEEKRHVLGQLDKVVVFPRRFMQPWWNVLAYTPPLGICLPLPVARLHDSAYRVK